MRQVASRNRWAGSFLFRLIAVLVGAAAVLAVSISPSVSDAVPVLQSSDIPQMAESQSTPGLFTGKTAKMNADGKTATVTMSAYAGDKNWRVPAPTYTTIYMDMSRGADHYEYSDLDISVNPPKRTDYKGNPLQTQLTAINAFIASLEKNARETGSIHYLRMIPLMGQEYAAKTISKRPYGGGEVLDCKGYYSLGSSYNIGSYCLPQNYRISSQGIQIYDFTKGNNAPDPGGSGSSLDWGTPQPGRTNLAQVWDTYKFLFSFENKGFGTSEFGERLSGTNKAQWFPADRGPWKQFKWYKDRGGSFTNPTLFGDEHADELIKLNGAIDPKWFMPLHNPERNNVVILMRGSMMVHDMGWYLPGCSEGVNAYNAYNAAGAKFDTLNRDQGVFAKTNGLWSVCFFENTDAQKLANEDVAASTEFKKKPRTFVYVMPTARVTLDLEGKGIDWSKDYLGTTAQDFISRLANPDAAIKDRGDRYNRDGLGGVINRHDTRMMEFAAGTNSGVQNWDSVFGSSLSGRPRSGPLDRDGTDHDREYETNLRYMKLVSSDTVGATSMSSTPEHVENKYIRYLKNNTWDDPNPPVVEDMVEEYAWRRVSSVKPEVADLDASTQLNDFVSPYFKAHNLNASSVRVYKQSYKGRNHITNKDKWDTPQDITGQVSVSPKTGGNGAEGVSVTGFDYANEYVSEFPPSTVDDNDDPHGSRLIVQFEVPVQDCFLGGSGVPTNDESSGVYKANGATLVGKLPVPTVEVALQPSCSTVVEGKAYQHGELNNLGSLLRAANGQDAYEFQPLAGGKRLNDFASVSVKFYKADTPANQNILIGTYTIAPATTSGTWSWAPAYSTPASRTALTEDVKNDFTVRVSEQVSLTNGTAGPVVEKKTTAGQDPKIFIMGAKAYVQDTKILFGMSAQLKDNFVSWKWWNKSTDSDLSDRTLVPVTEDMVGASSGNVGDPSDMVYEFVEGTAPPTPQGSLPATVNPLVNTDFKASGVMAKSRGGTAQKVDVIKVENQAPMDSDTIAASIPNSQNSTEDHDFTVYALPFSALPLTGVNDTGRSWLTMGGGAGLIALLAALGWQISKRRHLSN